MGYGGMSLNEKVKTEVGEDSEPGEKNPKTGPTEHMEHMERESPLIRQNWKRKIYRMQIKNIVNPFLYSTGFFYKMSFKINLFQG